MWEFRDAFTNGNLMAIWERIIKFKVLGGSNHQS